MIGDSCASGSPEPASGSARSAPHRYRDQITGVLEVGSSVSRRSARAEAVASSAISYRVRRPSACTSSNPDRRMCARWLLTLGRNAAPRFCYLCLRPPLARRPAESELMRGRAPGARPAAMAQKLSENRACMAKPTPTMRIATPASRLARADV